MRDNLVKRKQRVFLLDEHPLVREWLIDLLHPRSDVTTCGEADNVRDAFSAIAILKPDVVIMDLALKDTSGIEFIKKLKRTHPEIAVLVFTVHEESFYAQRAIRSGARGYIMKREPTSKVLTAIDRVLEGRSYISESLGDVLVARQMEARGVDACSPVSRLSEREWDVFELLGQGCGVTKIAQMLHISMKTVHAHCARMRDRLGLRRSRELLREAIHWHEAGMIR